MSDLPDSLAVECLPHKTWTRDEVAVLESTGLFDGTHFELIDGELIDKMGKKRKHVCATTETAIALEAIFGRDYVNQEAPIDVAPEDKPRNEPEPDVIVLRRRSREIEGNPKPADLALIVEVADTTLRQDLKTKARLYARAGIPEYWVLDLNGRRLCVFRHPAGGAYQTELECSEDASVATLEKPTHTIAVRSLLP
ncbi:MAG: Uma2 family endonuclease [Bryobacteraceae bacterium]|nr:Uma2 family endonuclease [Bryobacteraceae bacterium]